MHTEAKVTSKYGGTYTTAHHGIEYTFEPGKEVTMPVAAAIHIFGFNLKDRTPAWKRMGFTDKQRGEDFLDKFKINYIELVPREEAEELENLRVLLDQKEQEGKDLSSGMQRAVKEIENLRTQIEEQNSIIGGLRVDLEAGKSANAVANEEIESLRKQLTEAQKAAEDQGGKGKKGR